MTQDRTQGRRSFLSRIAAGAGAFGRFGQGAKEVHVGTRGVFAAEADFEAERQGGADEFGQFAQQPGTILLQFVGQVLVGGRH